MKVSDKLLNLIATPDWEGCRLKQYPDQAGLPTIGIGHLLTPFELSSGTITIDGIVVRFESGISMQNALGLLGQDMHAAENTVNNLVHVPLEQNQFDALCSLTFNIGSGGFGSSTVLRMVNARDFIHVPDAFMMWNKVHREGKLIVSNGLTDRRKNEIKLWKGEI